MDSLRVPPGTSLIELIFTLVLLGILLGLGLPPLRRLGHVYAVRSARDALAAGVMRTRVAATSRGGATLVVDVEAGRFWIEGPAGDTLRHPVDLSAEYGVELDGTGAADTVRIRFDGLGLGRLANRTLRVSRGGAQAGLTLSSYGRVRAW